MFWKVKITSLTKAVRLKDDNYISGSWKRGGRAFASFFAICKLHEFAFFKHLVDTLDR